MRSSYEMRQRWKALKEEMDGVPDQRTFVDIGVSLDVRVVGELYAAMRSGQPPIDLCESAKPWQCDAMLTSS